MPEGDTIHAAARRVGAALIGRLAGRPVLSVDAHGKHLFMRFEGDLTLHSHLRTGGMMTESRTRFDLRLAALGPDILAPELDESSLIKRLRGDDPTRGIGDALLDQRNVAGIGNVWKSEGCFHAGIDPWRRIVRGTRVRMQDSVARGQGDDNRTTYWCPGCQA